MSSTLTLLLLLHVVAIVVVVGFIVALCVFSGSTRTARKQPADRSHQTLRWQRAQVPRLRRRLSSAPTHAAKARTAFGA